MFSPSAAMLSFTTSPTVCMMQKKKLFGLPAVAVNLFESLHNLFVCSGPVRAASALAIASKELCLSGLPPRREGQGIHAAAP